MSSQMTTNQARYRTNPMVSLWSEHTAASIERQIWYWVWTYHSNIGIVPSDPDVGIRLASNINNIDLDSIRIRERIRRHDLVARLEEYIDTAGVPQVLHIGMTSADIVENRYLIQMAETCEILGDIGWSETLPFRGIKGPVGTQHDQIDLAGGNPDVAHGLDQFLADKFGFRHIVQNVAQTMHRSVDLAWAMRLISKTGVNVDPIISGYLQIIANYAGTVWNDGDVSTSVCRRYALPGLACRVWDVITEGYTYGY